MLQESCYLLRKQYGIKITRSLAAGLSVWRLPEAIQCCGKEIHGERSAKAVELKDKPWESLDGRRKASLSGWLRVPERIYSQLGEYFGVAGKGSSWNRKKTKSTSRGKAGSKRSWWKWRTVTGNAVIVKNALRLVLKRFLIWYFDSKVVPKAEYSWSAKTIKLWTRWYYVLARLCDPGTSLQFHVPINKNHVRRKKSVVCRNSSSCLSPTLPYHVLSSFHSLVNPTLCLAGKASLLTALTWNSRTPHTK